VGALNSTGQATFATTTLAVGSHAITAVYGGDSNFSGSTATALNQPPQRTRCDRVDAINKKSDFGNARKSRAILS
jgi:hypothetical protein